MVRAAPQKKSVCHETHGDIEIRAYPALLKKAGEHFGFSCLRHVTVYLSVTFERCFGHVRRVADNYVTFARLPLTM